MGNDVTMHHFYQESRFGEQWFGYESVYEMLVRRCPDGGTIVEVGAWKGRSTCFLAVEAANSGKRILVVAEGRLFEVFLENTRPVAHLITPVRMTSIQASERYPDGSLDAVFLDASHKYEDVRADILAWLPKVKSGGILAGHDYTYRNDDWPDVRRAVDEAFPVLAVIGACWIHLVPCQ
jgi:predicted O-methyltransferase YrrM